MVNWTTADERFATHALKTGRVDRDAWKMELASVTIEPDRPSQGVRGAWLNRLRLLRNLRVRLVGLQSQGQPL